ncbi:hypothetical protein MJD09_09720, partial [bacterium]|nr:hypothetical protein [bacterium]
PKLKQRTRKLRKNSTLPEVLLWNELKARKMRAKRTFVSFALRETRHTDTYNPAEVERKC